MSIILKFSRFFNCTDLQFCIITIYSLSRKEFYMARRKVSARKDRKIFSKVAKKTKAINVSPKNMRGGIRL